MESLSFSGTFLPCAYSVSPWCVFVCLFALASAFTAEVFLLSLVSLSCLFVLAKEARKMMIWNSKIAWVAPLGHPGGFFMDTQLPGGCEASLLGWTDRWGRLFRLSLGAGKLGCPRKGRRGPTHSACEHPSSSQPPTAAPRPVSLSLRITPLLCWSGEEAVVWGPGWREMMWGQITS